MRNIHSLDGTWTLEGGDEFGRIDGQVPGCVHADLLRAERIPDPYYRDNELAVQWVGERDWTYAKTFDLPASLGAEDHIELVCEGLDTIAQVTLNGHTLGRTDNMFRTWNFPVKEALREGRNELRITFRSVLPYMRRKHAEHPLHTIGVEHRMEGTQWVRKEPCNFGWDWGPKLVTCGIWRSIRLQGWSDPVLDEVEVRQSHEGDAVELELRVTLKDFERSQGPERLAWRLRQGDSLVADGVCEDLSAVNRQKLRVEHPALWWPRGMGAQPLYHLEVELLASRERLLDQRSLRMGLRQLELICEDDSWGQSFHFRANGRDFFAKGANWIPADAFDARVADEALADLLQSAVWAEMNCIRVWGGGLYERDRFYDLCDELGLVVWQDFMFACSAYPAHEKAFMDNVRLEAIDNVRRLRHHPSILLWCGNNELEHISGLVGEEPDAMPIPQYEALFDKLLADVVREEDGQRPYWPSSEHSPRGERYGRSAEGTMYSQDPRWGDAHLWGVWHGNKPFEYYRECMHRFCSEFGFQSLPHPATIESYTREEDRNLTSYVMEFHQRSPIGNAAMIRYLLSWFRLPEGHEATVWLTQIVQSLAIKYAVEHWRRNMPRCMGALYWQLNDCWPVASWSSIDSRHRWKALHYAARKFFGPILVSGVEKLESATLDVFVSSDLAEERAVRLEADWVSLDGATKPLHRAAITTPVNGSSLVAELSLEDVFAETTARDGLVALRLIEPETGCALSDNTVLFARPKHLALRSPEIEAKITESGDSLVVNLRSVRPSLWTWLSIDDFPDARWSDNFFALLPGGETAATLLNPPAEMTAAQLQQRLTVQDLTQLSAASGSVSGSVSEKG